VIGVRNRRDYRLRNALKSLRSQSYPSSLIRITVVDYGSRLSDIAYLRGLCEEFSADYLRVRRTDDWNRAHCLNIGIKAAKTKYTLTSDVDIVFDKGYIAESIKELRRNPYQIVYGEMWDSLEGQITATTDVMADYHRIKEKCIRRSERNNDYNYTFGMSIITGLTFFFREISGHDEQYRIWGFEDDDIVLRFRMMGLKLKKLPAKTAYIHQWHPANFAAEELERVKKNNTYFSRSHSIKRNPSGWGEPVS
jgi:GT2 family glycosyltransferase